MEYTEDQQRFIEGVRDFLYEDFPRKEYISLQGPPGSGKTQVISRLVDEFPDKKFVYVCYSGKAASNLMGKGIVAQTIHSTFYRVKNDTTNLEFELLPKSMIPRCNVIVIDEVSMVPQSMFRDLLSYKKKIICVGDRGQLGPVKAKYNTILDNPDYTLTTIHRQEETSGILRLAKEFSSTHKLPSYGQYSDDIIIIPKDKVTQEMILSVNQTICGMNDTRNKWNSEIRKAYHHYDYFPEPGERVICCSNTQVYIDKRRVINGTTGTVEKVKLRGRSNLLMTFRPDWALKSVSMKVDGINFIDGTKSSSFVPNVYTFDFSYVITVNKAQGSEWDSVLFIVDHDIPRDALIKNINTGITRAKKKLILAY